MVTSYWVGSFKVAWRVDNSSFFTGGEIVQTVSLLSLN